MGIAGDSTSPNASARNRYLAKEIMKSLNCRSSITILNSLEQIFGIPQTTIMRFIDGSQSDDPSSTGNEPALFPDQLISDFQDKFDISNEYERTHWFHATRACPDEVFSDGLLPTHLAAGKFWPFLYQLVSTEIGEIEWRKFRNFVQESKKDRNAELYQLKTQNIDQSGPFGFLYRHMVFKNPDSGVHSYIGIPESIEDICNCFCERFSIDLSTRFKDNTSAFIVEFFDNSYDIQRLHDALYFLYCERYGFDGLNYFSEAFSGEGKPVPKEQIITIEPVTDAEIQAANPE